jgi:RHS repeat-associated protein
MLDTQPALTYVLAATTGSATERYVHGPMGIHAMENAAGNWLWAGQDGIGNVRFEADETLAVLGSREVAPYLAPFNEQGVFDLPFVGTGEMRDPNGLQYHRARYMNPILGTFVSLDPFEGAPDDPMSLNGYGYVAGNPANWTDPSGACPATPADAFDWRYYRCWDLARGLAARFNAPVENFSWMTYEELEAATLRVNFWGSATDVTGGASTFMNRAVGGLENVLQMLGGCSNVTQAGGGLAVTPIGQGIAAAVILLAAYEALRIALANSPSVSIPTGTTTSGQPRQLVCTSWGHMGPPQCYYVEAAEAGAGAQVSSQSQNDNIQTRVQELTNQAEAAQRNESFDIAYRNPGFG